MCAGRAGGSPRARSMGQHALVRGNGGAFTCHSTRPSLGPGLLLSPIAHEPCTSKPTSPPPPPNCQPSAPTPARPSQPPQKVADPLETHRIHTPRAGSGVNRRNRRARIDQAPPEEGHSNCCEQGIDRISIAFPGGGCDRSAVARAFRDGFVCVCSWPYHNVVHHGVLLDQQQHVDHLRVDPG